MKNGENIISTEELDLKVDGLLARIRPLFTIVYILAMASAGALALLSAILFLG